MESMAKSVRSKMVPVYDRDTVFDRASLDQGTLMPLEPYKTQIYLQ